MFLCYIKKFGQISNNYLAKLLGLALTYKEPGHLAFFHRHIYGFIPLILMKFHNFDGPTFDPLGSPPKNIFKKKKYVFTTLYENVPRSTYKSYKCM